MSVNAFSIFLVLKSITFLLILFSSAVDVLTNFSVGPLIPASEVVVVYGVLRNQIGKVISRVTNLMGVARLYSFVRLMILQGVGKVKKRVRQRHEGIGGCSPVFGSASK